MTQLTVYTQKLPPAIKRSQILQWLSIQEDLFLWENAAQTQQLLTAGQVLQVEPGTIASFAVAQDLLRQAQASFQLTASSTWQDVKLVGSFLFDSEDARNGQWGTFQQGIAYIPQVSFVETEDQWQVTLIAADDSALEPMMAQILQLAELQPQTLELGNYQEQKTAQWQDSVAQTVAAIQQQHFQKVVLARTAMAQQTAQVNWVAVWLHLSLTQPGYHILLQTRDVQFISITPERLAKFLPNLVQTGAVAGTTANDLDAVKAKQLAKQLLQDVKNRQEHDIVVQGIKSVLQQANLQVQAPSQPQILATANLQHLWTPITGRGLVRPLTIIERLHPTPALGGFPQAQAVAWIRKVETQARGLFGAPIGYLSAQQTGEFAVGIRSALVQQQQLSFFAGAGIVADSDPVTEFRETGAKLQSLYQALTH
ncbi:isochorismate synthase [Bombilactobacillus folatiphilus]|uniref:isochorismate synthase n=1 Tax=Bombilactobacillus folatiphilus TaxID=2923362 RepID=A0ABY4P8E2_9LACO|nr:isochorismate synthase [Bombilactobacillus folatiphilus]UQS81801.1 isochorismate synthase [Bombilactobacillus folatiphilus]